MGRLDVNRWEVGVRFMAFLRAKVRLEDQRELVQYRGNIGNIGATSGNFRGKVCCFAFCGFSLASTPCGGYREGYPWAVAGTVAVV